MRLFIKNLPLDITDEDLSTMFSIYGKVVSAKVITDADSGESRGFGFIAGDDGEEYFVHLTGLKPGVSITKDDRVSFKVIQGDRGPKAEKVEKIVEKIKE